MSSPTPRIAVIGHVEHVTVGRLAQLPPRGGIAHMEEVTWLAGGGGGVAFWQLARSPAELHLFTAVGADEAGAAVGARLAESGAIVHAAPRDEPHTRDLAIITPDGARTIFVVGEPLHPMASDRLPWEVLSSCDAAYFTAQDPEALKLARAARLLVVTARRAEALARAGVRADVVVGSMEDPREASVRADYAVPPGALVMTAGAGDGRIETADGMHSFRAPPAPARIEGSYGAGDSFAGALVWYLVRRLPLVEACERAGEHGAAVLATLNPLDAHLPLR